MTIAFQKWQGAGNDFILVDIRESADIDWNPQLVRYLCDRHFGIGADGLMLLGGSDEGDFSMHYFNSDGLPADMCGNGGRCIVAMAHRLGIIGERARFLAGDGWHEAFVVNPAHIRLKMIDVTGIKRIDFNERDSFGYFLDTGVPHLVLFTESIEELDVVALGRQYRHDGRFAPAGTNVNFVKAEGSRLRVRTYERGVEGETLACGTGNVAAAIAAGHHYGSSLTSYQTQANGGVLSVSFRKQGSRVTDVWLEGPAVKVFSGEITPDRF
ncbi:MAG: diaminopimelate epimerase [Bacteroidales bacterium]